jgi:hypothetical protein
LEEELEQSAVWYDIFVASLWFKERKSSSSVNAGQTSNLSLI